MIVGTGIGVGLGRYSRWYVLMMVRGVDGQNIIYKLVAQRDDGYEYVIMRVKKEIDVEDVSEMIDNLVKTIMKNDRIKIFELIGGSGVLNLAYRRRAVWV
jgi:hypothetical protein